MIPVTFFLLHHRVLSNTNTGITNASIRPGYVAILDQKFIIIDDGNDVCINMDQTHVALVLIFNLFGILSFVIMMMMMMMMMICAGRSLLLQEDPAVG